MKQKFYDLAKKIADWHTVTFKDADKAGQLLKLDEEFDEWRAETADPEKRITELADCFISLLRSGFALKRQSVCSPARRL